MNAASLLGLLVAAVAYAVVTGLVVASSPGTRQAVWLVRALAVSCLWALSVAAVLWIQGSPAGWLPNVDALRAVVWTAFLVTLIADSKGVWKGWPAGRGLVVASAVLAGLVWVSGGRVLDLSGIGFDGEAKLLASLGPPLLALLGVEQVFRNASFDERRSLKPLALGLGMVFVLDIAVYSQAALFGEMSMSLWPLRGVGNAAAAVLILLTVKKQPVWEQQLFVSRHIVFHSATLIAAGLYLLALAGGGVLIGTIEGMWGLVFQALFLAGGAVVLSYALFSAGIHRRFKVFIAKHFYRNRYDYREEWLRLVRTLAAVSDEQSLAERCVKALADIIGSPGGELWFAPGSDEPLEGRGAWGEGRPPSGTLARTDAMVQFLERTRWIVDSAESARDPERYANAFVDGAPLLSECCIVVPLVHDGGLVGIVRLQRPADLGDLTFEDHDLLKTAGQQVAIFLVQERAQEQLSETRQLEAFTKLTAFLMHDLKNLIAQQGLVVSNARRYKHRPEFVDDAIRTIEAGVQRMKSILERLSGAATSQWKARVDLGRLLEEVCAACGDRLPAPAVTQSCAGLRAETDRDRLAMAVTHAVRNAQDATRSDGCVELRLRVEGPTALIEVVDTGSGMDDDFIRHHLFRPFDSTKGAKGMGIGAYQIRETLRAAGGDVEVSSVVGEGTTLCMKLPLAHDRAEQPEQSAA